MNCCMSELTNCNVAATTKSHSLASLQATSTSLDHLAYAGTYRKVTVLTQQGDTCTALQQFPLQRQQLHSLFYTGSEAGQCTIIYCLKFFWGEQVQCYMCWKINYLPALACAFEQIHVLEDGHVDFAGDAALLGSSVLDSTHLPQHFDCSWHSKAAAKHQAFLSSVLVYRRVRHTS
ncbi:TPA: hypothetical protein ACH3X1_004733 [Trebouxia sp. C0004]